jgi:2-polyprenyl-3-methyl-5-hydroxy-6-metoxy-1,4-benzoquinol methylase
MWDIKYLLTDWWKARYFQEFVNNRYSNSTDSDKIILSKRIFKTVGTEYGLFYLNNHCGSIAQIEEYSIIDMLPSDIVLDIGTNIGAFSIKACRKGKHVYAVEPIFYDIINKNINLYNIKNITVLGTDLGSGQLNIYKSSGASCIL